VPDYAIGVHFQVATTVKHVDFGPKRLVSEAYEAGSDDNITVVVVYLKPAPAVGGQS
jgi:serine/threonine protein phosphatase PrpC